MLTSSSSRKLRPSNFSTALLAEVGRSRAKLIETFSIAVFIIILTVVLSPRPGSGLFQVRPKGVNQVVGGQGLVIRRRGVGIENMKANVTLDHLGHQSIHSASASGNVVQYLGAFRLIVQRPFNCLYLASNSSDAIEQLLFFLGSVSHKKLETGLDKYTLPGIP
jgi:hypothetical protein